MNKNAFYDHLLDRYDAFYFMIRSVAILGSQNSESFDRDAQILVDFLGKVYGWRQELIDAAAGLILGDMMKVGLIADYYALASAEMLDKTAREQLVFFEMKGKAIEEVNRIEAIVDNCSEQKVMQEIRNSMNLSSFHHEYDPRVKFLQMKRKAANGEVLCSLQTAMMLILGIGCKSSAALAQRILERLLIWKEKSAAKILAFLWAQENDDETSGFYQAIFEWLDSSQNDLISLPPQSENIKNFSEYCTIISAVHSFITRSIGKRDIDAMFADLLNSEEITFSEKMEMIRHYKDGVWMNYYNKTNAKTKIGFLQ